MTKGFSDNALNILNVRNEGELVQAVMEAIDAGLYYAVPEKFRKYYEGSPYAREVDGLLRVSMPCRGAVQVGFAQDDVREALVEYIGFVHKFAPSKLGQKIAQYIPIEMCQILELDNETVSDIAQFITPQTLLRADVLDCDGRPWICDPNFQPLGMAYHAHYAGQFGGHQHSAYIDKLAKLKGKNGIISTLSYGNWTSHEYLAHLVREADGDFHLFPLEDWDAQRQINTLIRYVREPFDTSQVAQIVNRRGLRIYESFVWVAIAQLLHAQKIGEYEKIANVFVPSVMCRIDSGDVEVAISVNDNGTDVIWRNFTDAKPMLEKALETVGQNTPGQKRWIIKAAQSTGSKGVQMTIKTGFHESMSGLEKDLRKKCAGMELFILSPFIPSLVNIGGAKHRTKWDMFFVGDDLIPAGTHVFVTAGSQQLVHGGSGTSMWIGL